MINFRVGILGTGNIAGKVADTLVKLDAFEPYAVASRDIDRANEFGDQYNIEKRYGSYEELVNDPDVELIYVATPNHVHAEHAKLCINAGKPCLVEKPFSYNSESAAEVFKLAEEKNVFCGEAMWMRFLPMYMTLSDIISKNMIGQVVNIQCSLGFEVYEKERIKRLDMAGGALLDLGVYAANLMYMYFGGMPDGISSTCYKMESGVDVLDNITFSYKGGRSGSALISAAYKTDNNAKIYGTTGYIEITNFLNPEKIEIYRGGRQLVGGANLSEKQISGYEFQFTAARNAIILGNTETAAMTHKDSMLMLNLMDALRKMWKVRFPMEKATDGPQIKVAPEQPTRLV